MSEKRKAIRSRRRMLHVVAERICVQRQHNIGLSPGMVLYAWPVVEIIERIDLK